MDLYQYSKLYSLLWLPFDLVAVMIAIIGCALAIHGYSRTSRFVGFTLMICCLAALVFGVAVAFGLPFEEVERFSDEYYKHVKEPQEAQRFTLWGNIVAAFFAVVSLLSNLALLIGATYSGLKRWRKRSSRAPA